MTVIALDATRGRGAFVFGARAAGTARPGNRSGARGGRGGERRWPTNSRLRQDRIGRAAGGDRGLEHRQLVTPTAGEPTLGPPKTARSFRKVPLADVVVAALAHHVEVYGVGADGLVLHNDGAAVRRQRFGVIWRQLRATAGLPNARFHDTRHTVASTLLSGGVPVAAAAEYLGHSPAVLLGVPAHLLPADHARARSVIELAFARDAACHARVTEADSGTVARL